MGLPVCSLVPLDRGRIELVRAWRNQDRIRLNMFRPEPISAETHAAWFAGLAGKPDQKVYVFEQDARPIGLLYYAPAGPAGSSMGYYLGEEQIWPGTGLLLELAALDQAFGVLQATALVAEVLEPNRPPQRLHELFRLTACGPRAEPYCRDGQPIPVLVWMIGREQWLAQRESVLATLPRQVRAAAALLRLCP
jgi:UDP-4-amino-4,6-dideoxy-N-acetyl-beta-L-altrosamine N-acetyltransferase